MARLARQSLHAGPSGPGLAAMMPALQDTAVHLSDRHFRTIAELIEGQVGIKLPPGKRLMLEGRLQKRVRALNFSDLNEYVDNLFEADHFDAELTHLIDVVTTNKTDFFREPQHFTFMRDVAIPALLKSHGRRNARRSRPRVGVDRPSTPC